MSPDKLREYMTPEHPLWFVWAGGSLVFLWLFFWWSLGALTTDAFGGGFARAEDVRFLTVQTLEKQLFDTRRDQCKANTDKTKAFFGEQMQTLKQMYYEKLKRVYDEPACDEIVVSDEHT